MSDSHVFNPHGTTILGVRRNGAIALGGDGQVTLGNSVMKGNARKVRRLANDKVLAGFAGGTADAFTLFERFEGKLEKYGNLTRAAIELAKDWRSDRYLRRLEALLLVGRSGQAVRHLRQRRCDRAGLRRGRHRLGRSVRARRGARAAGGLRSSMRAASSSARSTSPPTSASTPTATSSSRNCNGRQEHQGLRCDMSRTHPPRRSSRNSTNTSSARTRPSARWRSRCATAGAACRSASRCARRSRRRTFS